MKIDKFGLKYPLAGDHITTDGRMCNVGDIVAIVVVNFENEKFYEVCKLLLDIKTEHNTYFEVKRLASIRSNVLSSYQKKWLNVSMNEGERIRVIDEYCECSEGRISVVPSSDLIYFDNYQKFMENPMIIKSMEE